MTAQIGHKDVVELLITKADVNIARTHGSTSLMNDSAMGHLSIVRECLLPLFSLPDDLNAKVTSGKLEGETALSLAEKFERIEIAKLLRAAGAV